MMDRTYQLCFISCLRLHRKYFSIGNALINLAFRSLIRNFAPWMKDISILIPTYNGICQTLVQALHQQAEALPISYEIIVADDGSTQLSTILTNRAINQISHCRYVERPENTGRAAIRNFLASQAQYPWLLFIDSDMEVCRADYLRQYATSEGEAIVYGGVVIGPLQSGNLRSMYEKASEQGHTPECRRQSPYHDFHTANFLVRRDLMQQHPFDLRFRRYGYEDVLFGKQMQLHHIPILHIDNPLSFEHFESNADFISKTEEGLRTLCQFRQELQDYSRLLHFFGTPASFWLTTPCSLLYRLLGSLMRRNLTSTHPSLQLFKLYKLSYLATLLKTKQTTSSI